MSGALRKQIKQGLLQPYTIYLPWLAFLWEILIGGRHDPGVARSLFLFAEKALRERDEPG